MWVDIGMMVTSCPQLPQAGVKEYLGPERVCCETEVLKQEETWTQCPLCDTPICLLITDTRRDAIPRWNGRKKKLSSTVFVTCAVQGSGSQLGETLYSMGHLAMSEDTLGCDNWGKRCYWHLVSRGQGCCQTSYDAQDSPEQQRTIWYRTSTVPRLTLVSGSLDILEFQNMFLKEVLILS